MVTIAQTVFGVRLTTVIRRLPTGAVEGCAVGSTALAVGLLVLFFETVVLGDGEAEALRLGEGEGDGDALRDTAGRAAVSWWAVVRVPPVPDGVHTL